MDTFSIAQFLGLIGFAGYMTGFAGQQFGLIDGAGKHYSLINLISALLVLVSLIDQFNLASAMIQISWIVISAVGLMMRHHQRSNGDTNVA